MLVKSKVLITGCSSGLGKSLALKFENEGHPVLRHNGKLHYDLNNQNEVFNLAEKAKEFGVSILINNAAIVCPNLDFENYSLNLIDNMINVNLKAPILLTYYLKSHLTNIININSMVGLEYKKRRTLYSATKWGLRGFANSLKLEDDSLNILDVYTTNIKTSPERINALDINYVTNSIYKSFENNEKQLILDGRTL